MKKFTFCFLVFCLVSNNVFGQCPTGTISLESQQEIINFVSNYPNCTDIDNLLSIGGTVHDLTPLSQIKSVWVLSISGTSDLINLDGLDNIVAVEELYITGNQNLNDISGLSNIDPDSFNNFYFYFVRIINNPNLSNCSITSICSLIVYKGLGDGMLINNNAFGCNSPNEIEASCDSFACVDHFIITDQEHIDDFPIECPVRSLTISGSAINNLDSLIELKNITGILRVEFTDNLVNLSGLANIDSIGSLLRIKVNHALTDISALDSVEYIGGCIEITNNDALTSISSFSNLDTINECIKIQDNPVLTGITGFDNIEIIGGHLYLNDNELLADLSGFNNLSSINGCLEVENNDALQNFEGFSNLSTIGSLGNSNSYLSVTHNASLTDFTGFENLENIFGDVIITDNDILGGLGGLINSDLGIGSITSIDIQNCPNLSICQVPCVCDIIMNEGEVTIANNAEGCNNSEQVDANCPLPIELLYLKATQYQGKAILTWSTATETNNSHFIIEHSIDAQQFTEVGRVAGSGTSLTPQTYSFIHERPHLGVNYYRLRQVDFDGTFEYSDIVNVEFERRGFHIFPNPVESALHLQFNTSQMEIEVNITSITGKVIHSKVVDFSGGPTLITFDIENYPVGVYFLSVNDGKEIQVQRFMKS